MKEQQNKPKKSLFKGNYKFCKKYGHKRIVCFKFKKWLEKKKKGNPLALVCFESNNINVPSNSWWLDTSATIHVTNFMQALRNLRRSSEGELIVRLGNGDKVQVEQIGVISLCLSTGYCLELKNVVFIHFMRRNLVFVTCLDQDGYFCYFRNKSFQLLDDSSVVGTST